MEEERKQERKQEEGKQVPEPPVKVSVKCIIFDLKFDTIQFLCILTVLIQ